MTGSEAGTRRQFGEGPLSRMAAWVYTVLVIEVLLFVTSVPGLVVLILLDRDASNLPVAVACALPFGPSLSAALYALHRRRRDLTDLKPARAFWHGYRINVGGVLRIWVPWLAVLAIIAVNLGHVRDAGVPGWWSVLLILIAVVAALWMTNAMVITSLFAFRARDIARLAAYFLVRTGRVTLGNLGLLILATGVTVATSEAVLVLVAAVFAVLLLHACHPMITQVRENFTA